MIRQFNLFAGFLGFSASLLMGGDSDASPFFEIIQVPRPDADPLPLFKTGETQRNFLFFPIYRMSHYAESLSGSGSVLDFQGTKAVQMEFLRTLKGGKVRDEFLNTLRDRASERDWNAVQAAALQYCDPFARGNVHPGDRFSVIWYSDGSLVSRFNGTVLARIHNPRFARLLWSLWVGQDSVVDPEDLLKNWKIDNTRAALPRS